VASGFNKDAVVNCAAKFPLLERLLYRTYPAVSSGGPREWWHTTQVPPNNSHLRGIDPSIRDIES